MKRNAGNTEYRPPRQRQESQLIRVALKLLSLRGIAATRHQSGSVLVRSGGIREHYMRLGEAGWPDIIGYTPDGRFMGLEAKTAAGRVRDAQAYRLAEIKASGGVAGTFRTQAELIEILQKHNLW